MKIGIMGQGYVGTAVRSTFEKYYDVKTYDKYQKEKTNSDIKGLLKSSDIIFVCVPTPMNPDGSCDTSIVEEVIETLNSQYSIMRLTYKKVIAIKSTIPPGTTDKLQKKYSNLGIVFNPEFLTEANFIDDFKNQNRIIIGGDRPYSTIVKQVYSKVFPNTPIIKTGSKTAEMVKYFTNTFLATKVSFANEMCQICETLGIDYDKVVEYSMYDKRIGTSHLSVPGPDGKKGFGGSCFPKDINAIMSVAEDLSLDPMVLKAVWDRNLTVRPEKDWEELKGRAVSENTIMGYSDKVKSGIERVQYTKKEIKLNREIEKKIAESEKVKQVKKDDEWELKA